MLKDYNADCKKKWFTKYHDSLAIAKVPKYFKGKTNQTTTDTECVISSG